MATDTPQRQAGEFPKLAPGPSGLRRWWWAAALVGALGVVATVVGVTLPGGSGGIDEGPAPGPPTEQEKAAVAEAWLGFVRIAVDVNNPPNPSRAGEVRMYASGLAYESVVRAIAENQQKGIATRLPPNSRVGRGDKVDVVSVHGDNAIARVCDVDDGTLVEIATGKVLNDRVVTTRSTVFFKREGGRWKVENNRVEQKWEGVSGCAV